MECPAPGSELEAIARATVQCGHGVDLAHRCDVAKCKFVPVKQKLRRFGRPARGMVCTKGLHWHWCGPGVCQLANTKNVDCDGAWTCPISRLEVTEQAEIYVPQRDRARSASTGQTTFTDTMTMKKRDKRRNTLTDNVSNGIAAKRARRHSAPASVNENNPSSKSHKRSTAKLLTALLSSPDAMQLKELAATKRERDVFTAVSNAGPEFFEQMSAARRACPRMLASPPPPECIDALAAAVDDFVTRIRPKLEGSCKGHASVVAACTTFLAAGLEFKGVTIVPKVPWVSARVPAPTDIGKIPGFMCRPTSISMRGIKAALFGAGGLPNSSLLFKCPGWLLDTNPTPAK